MFPKNLDNLSKINIDNNFLPIINGCINASLLIIFLCVYNLISNNLKNWYKLFNLTAFIFDVTTLLLILIFTKYLYHRIFSKFHFMWFIVLAVIIQVVYSFFYYFLVNNYWIKNDMFLFHKNYINDVGMIYYISLNIFIIVMATILSGYYCLIDDTLNIINIISSMYFYCFMINEI
jgi:hypothetical protein